MSLNEAVSAERVHISFFGRRNVGKSSLVNAITGQSLSVVSEVKGTTTDPVKKSMELLPAGPVVIIDTPGFDDEGELGVLRIQKTKEILARTEVAVFVTDATEKRTAQEEEFLALVNEKKLPLAVVYNKADLLEKLPEAAVGENNGVSKLYVSAEKNIHIQELKELLGTLANSRPNHKKLVADLLERGDVVVLVTPMDESAPKGRLILPQQQTIREILDAHAIPVVCQDSELLTTLSALAKQPKLVITDSQVFGKVAAMLPENILLTSFSILFARYKGELEAQVQGAVTLSELQEGDKVLVAEGCTHHRQCGDIGTVKLPMWMQRFSNAQVQIDFTSGGEFPADLSGYRLVVHCGGCMLNGAEMKHRLALAKAAGVPMTNYGVAIAHMNGILERSLQPFSGELPCLSGFSG